MRHAQLFLPPLAAIAMSACTVVVHDKGGDGGTKKADPVPPMHADMVWLVNLDHSAVNLAAPYEGLIREFEVGVAAIPTQPIVVVHRAVLALNRKTKVGARLFYGESVTGAVIDPA